MTKATQPWVGTDQTLVRAAINKILASAMFAAAPRQQRFLEYVVSHTLDGNNDRLKGYTIGIDVFDRGSDFDPNIDAIVRVEAARLRNKLREYYESDGRADAVIIELPKGSYGVDITLRGAPVAEAVHTIAKQQFKNVDSRPSLAVLPFVNLSPEPGQDYFVDGLVDSLIFELSRLSGLLIICRQSSFAYRNSAKSSAEIGSALGVKYLLEGSVQRSLQRVRVTITLVEASSGTRIWSERYENDTQEIFALQDALSHSIVKVLQIRLAGSEAEQFGHEGTNNMEAHDALLRGLECFWKYAPKSTVEARQHFTRAVELDPAYAAAHAWLARALLFLWIMKWDLDDSLREQACEHARRAVELNERLPHALAVLGWAHLWSKRREPAITACRKAVVLDPNFAEAHLFLSMCLSSAGMGEEALYYIEKGRRLNPHSSPLYEFALGQAYFVLEDYDKAITAFKRGCELSETFPPNHILLCTVYALLGREKEMRAKAQEVMTILGGDKSRMIHPVWLDEEFATSYSHLQELAALG
jgi:adenylate cyclase